MAKFKDVFGFDELEKAFNKLEKKYPNEADRLLMTIGQAVNKRTKGLTPVRTRKLRNSWRLKKVKEYKGGKVRVVRIQSSVPYAHLVEQGHEIVTGGKTRVRGRTLNAVQRSMRGIKSGGRVEGRFMLATAIKEASARFEKEASKMLDKLTKDVQI